MKNSSANSASKPAPLLKVITISAAVALLLGLIGWIVGVRQGREKMAEQSMNCEKRITKVESELGQRRDELTIAQNREHLMQVRAALYRSAIGLDKRNFGTANAHLKEAADSLSKIESDNANVKVANIANLRDAIAKTNINVAVNLEEQHAQVLSFATQLNELIPQPTSATQ